MDQIAPRAPAPGTTAAGNLYTDLQSRTLWLGVDPAVDPSGAVLISDIMSLQVADTTNLNTAKAYTDNQILTRAPTVHTHTSAQITDFNAAVTAVASNIPSLSYVRGMVIMYSGLLSDIGVGPLAGWALCDGTNGTPNLRDKFVVGAGNKVIGSTNPTTAAPTNINGDHVHVITGTTLTIAQLPSHNHGANTGYVSADHAHNVNLNTGGESADHSHTFPIYAGDGGRGEGAGGNGVPSLLGNYGTSGRNVAHYHNVQGGTSGVSANHYHAIPAQGGDASHTHTESQAGAHTHSTSSSDLRDALPSYALAFIMKL